MSYTWKTGRAISLLIAAVGMAPAQTFTTLASFDWKNGANPTFMALTQGLDGALYGTTTKGGTYGFGTIFKITSSGLTNIYNFDETDGSLPMGKLLLATDGDLYGTTETGSYGTFEGGTVFKITPAGVVPAFYSFDGGGPGAANPNAGLIEATDGNFYGTSIYRGAGGSGVAYRMTPAGVVTTLHSFDWYQPPNGAFPYAPLMQAAGGALYGTTAAGGAEMDGYISDYGEIYKITDEGESVVASFRGINGSAPYSGLLQASDGLFYGTTTGGGTYGQGIVFRMTPDGALTTLHSFNTEDGAVPYGALIQATEGDLYGMTSIGGASNAGTIFKITLAGELTVLHSFVPATEGESPNGSLFQATNGDLYGVTSAGGAYGKGTIFKLSVGLGPFVIPVPDSGAVGTTVNLLGTDFAGPIAVTFGGVPAGLTFTSATQITAVVPAGALSGKIAVSTSGGTLLSNVAFTVRQ